APAGPDDEDAAPSPAAEGADSPRRADPVPPMDPAAPSPFNLAWLRIGVVSAHEAERARAGLTADEVPDAGAGRASVVPGAAAAPPEGEDVRTVRVEVEDGLPVDGAAFAAYVMEVLNDPRGWGADGTLAFARTDGAADVRVVLASPDLTDRLCYPLRTLGQVSCAIGGAAVLNVARWSEGAAPFTAAGGTVSGYRHYLVNHEVGHVLGHGHAACPAPGELAPVMVQQTLDLQGCRPNGWPAP
ncbi:DUF3152 domain-containing protein, partial [Georgenia thermotolerans]